ncbi:MAG: hypothetical protein PHF86_00120 [Candidatus Nanoarchaeia archaeon]|nr:hypothetical protein [Candidatus Nanoarchaeia archaeon]
MKYIVIDRETGLDITNKVSVIQESTDDYKYCRKMADDMLNLANNFHEKEIMERLKLISNTKMESFGEDINRADLWSNFINQIYSEIDDKRKEYNEMMDIAGDWEDKEYAARWKRVVNFLASRSENPLKEKEFKNRLVAEYVTYMGAPNLAKYLI